MVVYVIRNGRTGQEYVGTTVQAMRTRWKEHLAFQKRGRRGPLYDAMQRDGVERFTVECIAECDSYEAMLDRERAEIAARGTLVPSGYNVVRGGRGNLGWKMSEETRQKIATKAAGRVAWNRGLAMSDEQRAKLSAVRRGRALTEAQRNVPQRQHGRQWSEDAKARLAAAKGAEWRARMANAQRGKVMSEEVRKRIAATMRAVRAQRFWSTKQVHIGAA